MALQPRRDKCSCRLQLTGAHRMSSDPRLRHASQVEKEVGKARGLMGEVEAELMRKKKASRRVKALRGEIAAAEAEAAALGAQQQHLERQRASLLERLQRLEHQARPKDPSQGLSDIAAAGSRCCVRSSSLPSWPGAWSTCAVAWHRVLQQSR